MIKSDFSCGSLREIEDVIETLSGSSDSLCFRGHSSSKWPLVPTAYRSFSETIDPKMVDPYDVATTERDTYREFSLEAQQEVRGLKTLEGLAIARHHGVPTRFLDWSLDFAVAAFFALSSSRKDDAALWVLNLSKYPFLKQLGRQHRGGGFRLENIEKIANGFTSSYAIPVSALVSTSGATTSDSPNNQSPPTPMPPDPYFVVWRPGKLDPRLERQRGLLSWVDTYDDDVLFWDYGSYIREVEQNHNLNLLHKIVIPERSREKVFDEILRIRRIDEYSIFGDLGGLAAKLTRTHQNAIAELMFSTN